MAVAIATTLYLTFGLWLILPTLGAPAVFPRIFIRLCASELLAAVAWGFTEARLWGSLAGLQIPVLAGLVGVIGIGYGAFVVRGW